MPRSRRALTCARSHRERPSRESGWGTTFAVGARMPTFATCAACHGFVADLGDSCVHCGAAPPRRRWLARVLATCLFGVATTVTLMACYGAGPVYDCHGEPGCHECSTDDECDTGAYCTAPPGGEGTCKTSSTCTADEQCPSWMRCDERRSTCKPKPSGCETSDDCEPHVQRCDVQSHACVPASACGLDHLCGIGALCELPHEVCAP